MDLLYHIPGDRWRECSWPKTSHGEGEGSASRIKSRRGEEGFMMVAFEF